MMTIMRNFIYH